MSIREFFAVHELWLDGLGRRRARCGDKAAWRFTEDIAKITCDACLRKQ